MATLLCHIQIQPGKAHEFEQVMKAMYQQTHEQEDACLRYEYFRAASENQYYCLLSFVDRHAFLQHQISDYHEGYDFAAMIESLQMEWVDPVEDASPLHKTESAALPGNVGDTIAEAAEIYPMEIQNWWLGHRVA